MIEYNARVERKAREGISSTQSDLEKAIAASRKTFEEEAKRQAEAKYRVEAEQKHDAIPIDAHFWEVVNSFTLVELASTVNMRALEESTIPYLGLAAQRSDDEKAGHFCSLIDSAYSRLQTLRNFHKGIFSDDQTLNFLLDQQGYFSDAIRRGGEPRDVIAYYKQIAENLQTECSRRFTQTNTSGVEEKKYPVVDFAGLDLSNRVKYNPPRRDHNSITLRDTRHTNKCFLLALYEMNAKTFQKGFFDKSGTLRRFLSVEDLLVYAKELGTYPGQHSMYNVDAIESLLEKLDICLKVYVLDAHDKRPRVYNEQESATVMFIIWKARGFHYLNQSEIDNLSL